MPMDQLTDYLTYTHPLGPEDASVILDPFCRRMLFQSENSIYARFRDKPTLIVGRKGSGKTAFLHSDKGRSDKICPVDLNSASAFALMLRTVQAAGASSMAVEPVAKIWDICFWLTFMFSAGTARIGTYSREFLLSAEEKERLLKFVSGLDPRHNGHSGAQFLVAAVQHYQDLALKDKSQPETLPDLMVRADVGGSSFESTKSLLEGALLNREARALLTIDSLDTRVDSNDSYDIVRDEVNFAISALLKSLGSFSQLNPVYDVRFCLPSERFEEFSHLSTNPAKDLTAQVTLNWSAAELISIAAHRLRLFMASSGMFRQFFIERDKGPIHPDGRRCPT
jgi:hypothetical protein